MFPADSDEYWPELQQAIDHWERRISDDPGMFNQLVWGLMVATHRAEAAEADTWTPVAELLPEPDRRVLAVYIEEQKPVIIRAVHLPAKYAACYDEYEEAEYDEETDTLYFPGGWYEAMESGEYAYTGPLSGQVTFWADLPALPARV